MNFIVRVILAILFCTGIANADVAIRYSGTCTGGSTCVLSHAPNTGDVVIATGNFVGATCSVTTFADSNSASVPVLTAASDTGAAGNICTFTYTVVGTPTGTYTCGGGCSAIYGGILDLYNTVGTAIGGGTANTASGSTVTTSPSLSIVAGGITIFTCGSSTAGLTSETLQTGSLTAFGYTGLPGNAYQGYSLTSTSIAAQTGTCNANASSTITGVLAAFNTTGTAVAVPPALYPAGPGGNP